MKNEQMNSGERWALLLAAGKGTRFRSDKAKVLHKLAGQPLAEHLLSKIEQLNTRRTMIVVGHQAAEVETALQGEGRQFVLQREQLGTGHAVMAAREELSRLEGSLLVVYGDAPLISIGTLRRLFETREREDADQVLLTCRFADPTGYGRIIRNAEGSAIDIIEEKDASPQQRKIQEINPGFYCFRISSLLEALEHLSDNNAQREYYLTDLTAILTRLGRKVVTITTEDPAETRGINDRLQLAQAERDLRLEIAHRWLLEGVTIIDPTNVWIDEQVQIGTDTTIYPGVFLQGGTSIGAGCTIRSYCHLEEAHLEADVVVDHCSVIRHSRISRGATIGPFAHLRQQAEIGPEARIGNFVEVKKSLLGEGSKAAHLAYLGDARIGERVNIGAGVITCNYDGFRKNETVIEDGAFLGSDSQLIAPLTVGRGAYVAAGSTITDDVPPESLAIARQRQTNKRDWAKRHKKKK